MELLRKQEKVCKTHPYGPEMHDFNEQYKTYLDDCKTERENVAFYEQEALKRGFKKFTRGDDVKAGDKIYVINRDRAVFLAIIGSKNISEGINLTASHIDVPRIDIRTVPVYEECGLAMFKTHYYGGIKKYQWLAIPLELRGVVFKKDGTRVNICIGKDKNDPVLTITDLLPHLGKDQMAKVATEIVTGENLNVLVGATPSEKHDKDPVKMWVLEYLYDTYGITEDDFTSADLSLVPAFDARDVGLDRSMVGAYGHDDRVCSYTTARALFDMDCTPEKTTVCALVDKEEVGSYGLTGMKSKFFELFIEDLCEAQNARLSVCFSNSYCLSTDVSNAYDPNYKDVSEPNNDSKLSNGIAVVKYTGTRGKSGTSEASAEMMLKIRQLFDNAGISWQTGQLGKIDQGGGGTVAYMISERNIETVDAGVPVLSMHAPFEVVSKYDVYMAYKAYREFFINMK